MSVIQKTKRGKKNIASCLLLACFLTMAAVRAVSAAPPEVPVTLTVEQAVDMPEGLSAGDTFTYQVTALEAGSPMPLGSVADTCTFTIGGTDSAVVGPIDFVRTGVYRYEIKQVVTISKTGYTYDGQIYTVVIYVKNSSSGLASEIIVQNSAGDKVGDIKFENSYAPLASDPSVMVDPPVRKTVTGNPGRDSTFTFKLEAKDKAGPMPLGSADGVKTVTITGSGEEEFGTWSYTAADTYSYTISEVNTGEAGYTYDKTVYTIADSVTDADGQLVVERTVTDKAGRQVSVCAFTNEFSGESAKGTAGKYTPAGGSLSRPKTGDNSALAQYAMLALTALLVLSALAAWKWKQKKRLWESNR